MSFVEVEVLNRKGHFVLKMVAAVCSVLLGCLCSDPQESS